MLVNPACLEGQVAIVTGGSRGIGKAVALALAEHGADVVVSSRGQAALDAVAAEIERKGRRALAVVCDVCRREDVEKLVDRTVAMLGRADILVNNAGILTVRSILETTEEEWDSLLAVNLKGPFLCSRAVAGQMIKQGSGCIINLSSNAGTMLFDEYAAYCVTKTALNVLTRAFARELAPHKIRVNAIAPGLVNTDMAAKLLADPEMRKVALSTIRLGFVAEPDEIARLAVYLASEESRYMTGSTILIDGGEVA